MSISASQDSSSMNTEKTADTEWMLSSPVIDNSMDDFFDELLPICKTDDQIYTYLADSSFLFGPIQNSTLPEAKAIEREGEVSKSIMTGAQNDKISSPTKHDLDVASATPPLSEGFTGANVGLSLNDKVESSTKHDLDSARATPPLPEDFIGVSAGLSQNNKEGSPTKQDLNVVSASRPSVAATQSKYVSARHVIVVEMGEDVAEKIMSFAKGGPKSISIRSATGRVNKVVLKRKPTSSEIETHEGLYNIVSLYGSYTLIEVQGKRWLIGALHICSAADGRTSFSGRVEGAVIAASQVEVIVMSCTEVDKEDS